MNGRLVLPMNCKVYPTPWGRVNESGTLVLPMICKVYPTSVPTSLEPVVGTTYDL